MSWRLHAYTGLQALGGSRIGRRYNEFLRLERLGPEAYRKECEKRLADLLAHARRNVPYYQERAAGSEASLQDFPILRRSDLGSYFTDLMTPRLRSEFTARKPRGYSWVTVQTGG